MLNKQGPVCYVGQFGVSAKAVACLSNQLCQVNYSKQFRVQFFLLSFKIYFTLLHKLINRGYSTQMWWLGNILVAAVSVVVLQMRQPTAAILTCAMRTRCLPLYTVLVVEQSLSMPKIVAGGPWHFLHLCSSSTEYLLTFINNIYLIFRFFFFC